MTPGPSDATPPSTTPRVELSVIVPTYGRPEKLLQLLARCDRQTLAPRRFEVIVVDDGTPEPIQIDPAQHRFSLTLLRQANAGPGAARNAAIARCRAPLVLFLNDDSLPAYDLFERHLEVHASRTDRVAVLGTFDFTPEALRHPFVQVLNDSDLLFDYVRARDGALHPWTFFWTCNLSVSLEALQAVGGFDAERFKEAICEDVEIGLRLSKLGYSVLFRRDLVCEHDHVLDVDSYFRRAKRLGVNSARLARKHKNDQLLAQPPPGKNRERFQLDALSAVESYHGALEEFLAKMRRLQAQTPPPQLPANTLAQLRGMVRRLSFVPFYSGQSLELEGFDPEQVMRNGPTRGRLTSIVVVSYDALEQTRACLERLRDTREDGFPTEIFFVDNGSTDGSAEFLAEQSDVRLIANATNLGAPHARNQALPFARGDYVVFLDNDAMVTPEWLSRLCYHAEVNPRSGCVAPTSDRAAHGQQVAMDCADDPRSIAQFARGVSQRLNRQHVHGVVLASYCLLVPRHVLDAIGGFDERFSPWGYEDDDFTLRATLAGFSNRIARDVFVRHEAYKGRRKLERHGELLAENWRRFAMKWQIPVEAANQSDQRLLPILERHWREEELRVPLATSARSAAPLPRQRRVEDESRRP